MLSVKASADVRALVRRDLSELAPKFRAAIEAALAECHARDLDAYVYEARRSDEVQRAYYELGRTLVPPAYTVTDAKTALGSWHFYGLAVDVISRSKGWGAGADWINQVAAVFERHGCAWGGRWTKPDLPHFQWGRCAASPRQAPTIYRERGLEAVWRAVGAL
jgi:hypothetical protein